MWDSAQAGADRLRNARSISWTLIGSSTAGRRSTSRPRATGEERWKTTAAIEGAFFTVVWTWRGESYPRDFNEASA